MNRCSILAAAFVACTIGGCQLEIHKVRMTNVAKHRNGLIMPVPDGFKPQQTADGFAVEPTTILRSPLEFTIQRTAESPAKHYSRRYIGLFGPYEHTLVDSAIGSSGANYRWLIWRELGACWLMMNATITTESEPDFLPAQAAFEQASITNTESCSGNN